MYKSLLRIGCPTLEAKTSSMMSCSMKMKMKIEEMIRGELGEDKKLKNFDYHTLLYILNFFILTLFLTSIKY